MNFKFPAIHFKSFSKLAWQCAVLFFVLIGIATIWLGYEIRTPHTTFFGTKTIEIIPGLGSRKIGALLKREGVIRSKWAFVTYVSLRNQASDLKPGIYAFNDRATIAEIAKGIIAGGAELTITIPEGWTAKEIGAHLDRQGIVRQEDFETITGPNAPLLFLETFAFLKERPVHDGLEGYLFPDTYRFFANTPTKDVVIRMLKNFNVKLSNDLREEISRQSRTIYEVITMASLIEKEAALDADREIVSGILWKRLGLGIPLQVDATLIFLTGRKTTKVLYVDTAIDSPYNTYKYKGLPRGPIANPGLSAIRAALYPKKSPYFYYLSTPEGRIIFSRTLREHNIAKAKYIR